jgi:hypothetical protein
MISGFLSAVADDVNRFWASKEVGDAGFWVSRDRSRVALLIVKESLCVRGLLGCGFYESTLEKLLYWDTCSCESKASCMRSSIDKTDCRSLFLTSALSLAAAAIDR